MIRIVTLTVVLAIVFSPVVFAQEGGPDTAVVRMKLPNGLFGKREEVPEGGSFDFAGFAFPLQYLNGGEIHFPEDSLPEGITLDIEIPDYAQIQGNAIGFGDSIASAVRFNVSVDGASISPYNFEKPVELTLPIPETLPTAIGPEVSQLALAFRDTTGNFDTTGVRTVIRDGTLGIVKAEVEHFSDVVMTSEKLLGDTPTEVVGQEANIASDFVLHQNSPNPFNPSTTISYELPARAPVSLKIYDITGRLVRTLVQEEQPANRNTVSWDATDNSGRNVASGIYFYRLRAGDLVQTRRMVLLR